jgi:restriction system protein
MRAAVEWHDYQEEVAQFFRDLGLTAETNTTVHGVRTSHDVDVVVRGKLAGIAVTWLVECKSWRDRIPKEKVLALRSIVEDTGADRGFMMAEGGYQSGALEAARLSNTTLGSLQDLRETLAYDLGMAKLDGLWIRCDAGRQRYWAIDKEDRIEFGLRPDTGALGYSGNTVVNAVEGTLHLSRSRGFPIVYERSWSALNSYGGSTLDWSDAPADAAVCDSPIALFEVLDRELGELEQRLDACETELKARAKKTYFGPDQEVPE